jgi:hypothetical protein
MNKPMRLDAQHSEGAASVRADRPVLDDRLALQQYG